MSPGKAFDRFMLHVDLGTEEKLAEFSDSERLCHIVGVLAIAAKSPIRGRLIVGEAEATAAHIAKRADVSRKVAESTLRKLKDVGILVRDETCGAWAVHSWERFNPPPKVDRTNAERQARFKARHGNGSGNAVTNGRADTGNDHEVEVEVEVEVEELPPLTPRKRGDVFPATPSGNRTRQKRAFDETSKAFAAEHFPGVTPSTIGHVARGLRENGIEPTASAIAEHGPTHPKVGHYFASARTAA